MGLATALSQYITIRLNNVTSIILGNLSNLFFPSTFYIIKEYTGLIKQLVDRIYIATIDYSLEGRERKIIWNIHFFLLIGHSPSRSKMLIFPVETFYCEVLQAPCGEGALLPCLDDPYGFLNLSSHWIPGASHILKDKVLGRIDVLCFWSSMFVIDMFSHPGSTRFFSVRN